MSIRRPELTGAEQKSVLARKVVELVDAVNAAGSSAEIDALEERVGDAEDAIDDLEARLTTSGSIFSMTGPTGATPIVAYDFTRFDNTLTVAQNLTNANQSGDSSYDLVQVGAGQITYQESDAPFALHPFAARGDGGALNTSAVTNYAETAATAALQLTAAMSAEWLGYINVAPGAAEDCHLFWCAGSGETEAVNQLYGLAWSGSTVDAWTATHESGAGTNSDAGFHVTGVAKFTAMQSVPAMFTLTRASGGEYRLYVNGHLAADADTAAPTALPTGGTSSKLAISPASTTAVLSTLGFRLFGVELTAAQVRESYRRTFFGMST